MGHARFIDFGTNERRWRVRFPVQERLCRPDQTRPDQNEMQNVNKVRAKRFPGLLLGPAPEEEGQQEKESEEKIGSEDEKDKKRPRRIR